MKKKILCLAMTMLMVMGSVLTANAEDFEGSKGWLVTFDGDEMVSNFKSAQMTEEILQIQPGDTITLQVGIKNDGTKDTDWYMTNEVLQTLEESQSVAEGGAYTYHLAYFDSEGAQTVLYTSETVGGEGAVAPDQEGLHQATDALEDYFFLERLASGESGTVKLIVQLDGETQGNDYQNTLAKLQLNFAVEEIEENATTTVGRIVKTGDDTPILMFSIITLISGLVLLMLVLVPLKKRNQKKGE